jgi:hypothetical protein
LLKFKVADWFYLIPKQSNALESVASKSDMRRAHPAQAIQRGRAQRQRMAGMQASAAFPLLVLPLRMFC